MTWKVSLLRSYNYNIEEAWLPIIRQYEDTIKRRLKYKKEEQQQRTLDGTGGQSGNSGTEDMSSRVSSSSVTVLPSPFHYQT